MRQKNDFRKGAFYTLLLATLSLECCFQPAWAIPASVEQSDRQTLETWKASAKATHIGVQLTQMLDGTNRALAVNPHDKAALFRRAYLFGTIGCTDSAISDLTKTLQLDANYAPAYTERAVCYIDQKNYPLALADLNRAIQLNPYSGDALMARGRLWLLMGKAEMALPDFQRSKANGARFTPVLPGELPGNFYDAPSYYIGTCYEAMDKPQEALKFYKASMNTQPKGTMGFLHRYADQPLDLKYKVSSLEGYYGN